MTTWLGSINAKHSANWEICKREELFGSDRPPALRVRAGDDILVWGAKRGWLGRLRATSDARSPGSLTDVPWPDAHRYKALIPMTVLDEPATPLFMPGDEFMTASGVHTVQIRNFEQLSNDRAAYVVSLLVGKSSAGPSVLHEAVETSLGPLADRLLDDLGMLRVDGQLGRPAPYQQLVLLWAISRADRGEDRLQAFSMVVRELSDLLGPFAVGRTAPDPAYPWYALRKSLWWRLVGVPEGSEDRGRDAVRQTNPAGGLSQDAHQLIVTEPKFRRRAITSLRRAIEGHPAGTQTIETLFPAGQPAFSRFEESLRLLLSLQAQELTTTTGAVNRILRVEPPSVLVATDRSPAGQPVQLADVQNALDLLRIHGAVTIDVETLGHRSSFVGAVLRAVPDVSISGSPPVAVLGGRPVEPEPWDPEPVFAGDTSITRTVEARREQGRLRAVLFGTDLARPCAICGEEYPLTFLRAAHIKPRHDCSEEERRQLRRIAMAACVFGCDALFEAGYVSVADDGVIQLSDEVRDDATLSRRAGVLDGRRCAAHNADTAEFFQWHRDHRFRI